jgi:UDP-N-acetylmuramyl pentapeptide phosphotransferase/UDP-N-acetylglucosamine-1-phosphate transferase
MTDGLVLLLAFLLTALLCRRFTLPGSRFHVLDHPGERSLHQQATPRSGGIALVAAILLAWMMAVGLGRLPWNETLAWLIAGVLLLAVTGGVDDRVDLSPLKRLLVQLLAAFFLLAAGLVPEILQLPGMNVSLPCYLAFGFTLLFILWMTNLYNFMDGMDGFAGGMAVIGFGAMAWLGWRAGDPAFALAALVVVAANIGFLVFNFPPARIFMGDAGSPVLGYLAAAFMLQAERTHLFPLWLGGLLFSPFIMDATYTLLRRLLAGKRIWQAHREHVYQRLVQTGWSHRRTVLWAYLLMFGAAISARMALELNPWVQWVILAGWIVIYLAIILLMLHREKSDT